MAAQTTNTQSVFLRNIVDRNTLVWWTLLLVSIFLFRYISPWGGLFWFAALLVDDIFVYGIGKTLLFDPELRARRNYQWIHNMYDNTTGSGRDLGFNLVVDGQLSQRAKWEHMARELGLKPGMAICDVGCGYGDWLRFCRDEIGCTAIGINLTPEQAVYARQHYGLEIHITNWKDVLTDPQLQNQLYGRFDAVTFMDTVEHYVGAQDRRNSKKQEQIYTAVCLFASSLLRRDSKPKRVFMSCLHYQRMPRNLSFYFHGYLMDKFYSGHYPFTDEGPIKFCKPWFNVVKIEDKTEDYRLTGVKDRKHFQAVKVHLTPGKVAYMTLMLLLDPFVIHRLIYYKQDSWMFLYGENAYSLDYDAEYRKRVSQVLLYWITMELKTDHLPDAATFTSSSTSKYTS